MWWNLCRLGWSKKKPLVVAVSQSHTTSVPPQKSLTVRSNHSSFGLVNPEFMTIQAFQEVFNVDSTCVSDLQDSVLSHCFWMSSTFWNKPFVQDPSRMAFGPSSRWVSSGGQPTKILLGQLAHMWCKAMLSTPSLKTITHSLKTIWDWTCEGIAHRQSNHSSSQKWFANPKVPRVKEIPSK